MQRRFPRASDEKKDLRRRVKSTKIFRKSINEGASTSKEPMASRWTIKTDYLKSNLENEEKSLQVSFRNTEMFAKWMSSVGAITVRKFCNYCGNVMKIRQEYRGNEIWCCSSGNKRCLTYRMDENFGFKINTPILHLTKSLYMWYRNNEQNIIIRQNMLTIEDYIHLNSCLTEVCIRKCIGGSRKIGGFKVRINVEIGKRGGLTIQNNPVICGINPKDDSQYFLIVMSEETPTEAQVRSCLKNFLLPGTRVFTTSVEHEIPGYMNWFESSDWPLIVNTGNLAKDLWIHVNQNIPNLFHKFLSDVTEIVREINF